jgi:hypothetical protein
MAGGLKVNGRLIARPIEVAAGLLEPVGQYILQEANKTIPIDQGTLQRSGQVTVGDLEVVVSYDTPYAVRQHEDTRLRHAPGRRAKWLERTLQSEARYITDWLSREIGRQL